MGNVATIRKRKDTRGERYQAIVKGNGYPMASRTFATKKEAEKWARQLEAERDRGVYVDRNEAEKNTLWAILGRYAKEVSPTKRGGTLEATRIKAIQAEKFSQIKLAALSARELATWRDKRLQCVSGSTVNRELNIISAVINHARKEWGIHMENPVALVRRPKNNPARDRRFEGNEAQRLLDSLEDPGRDKQGRLQSGTRNAWIRPLVLVAIETAMRRGELLKLEWKHVDLKRRVAHLPDTKNGEPRNVPLSAKAVDVLDALARSIDGRVFPVTADALKKAFNRACERAGVANFHFHDLRHEATSRMAEKLPNVIELAAVTGHRDLRMLKRYYHPRVEDLAKKLDRTPVLQLVAAVPTSASETNA